MNTYLARIRPSQFKGLSLKGPILERYFMKWIHLFKTCILAFLFSISFSDCRATEPVALNAQYIESLVNGTYFGAFRLGYHAGEYLNNHFTLSNAQQDWSRQSFTWVTKQGTYNAMSGYWVFRCDANQCWQAVNTSGPLALWNTDGRARGNPEDWELFVFEFANPEHTQVFVKNVYGRYVRYQGPSFVCDADRAHAASFIPEF